MRSHFSPLDLSRLSCPAPRATLCPRPSFHLPARPAHALTHALRQPANPNPPRRSRNSSDGCEPLGGFVGLYHSLAQWALAWMDSIARPNHESCAWIEASTKGGVLLFTASGIKTSSALDHPISSQQALPTRSRTLPASPPARTPTKVRVTNGSDGCELLGGFVGFYCGLVPWALGAIARPNHESGVRIEASTKGGVLLFTASEIETAMMSMGINTGHPAAAGSLSRMGGGIARSGACDCG
ncbi:hypothetical protein EDB83DRAFT_2526747 [Lactarius deliciosus]|nr:hypothetical protein EDB83DRAFT_2526747 [Lactarius deliciosus]